MTVRPEIAALIAAGHTDSHIAFRLGCHRSTVNRARNDLTRLRATQDRLLAEELPTGHAWTTPRRQPISPHRAAANYNALAEAIGARPARRAA